MEEIQPFIQYGGLGIGAFAMWILYKVITNHEKHYTENIKENTECTRENTRVLQELKDIIISLKR